MASSNYVEIFVRARDQATPELDDLKAKLDELKAKVATARATVDDEGAAAKLDALDAKLLTLSKRVANPRINMQGAVAAEAQIHGVESSLDQLGEKSDEVSARTQSDGENAFKKWGELALAASPIISAALLGGVATAVAGLGILVLKSNQQIDAAWKQTSHDIGGYMVAAAQPMVPAVVGALGQIETATRQAAPQLDQLFAGAAKLIPGLTTGVLSLATNALPGLVTATQAGQRVMAGFDSLLGSVGQGINGLMSGLAGGTSGASSALVALGHILDGLLTDIGQIVGHLSQGLGPALGDIAAVAMPVAHAFTQVIDALPAPLIRADADALGALFAAFKVGQIAGLISEEQGFFSWIGSIATRAYTATTAVLGFTKAEEGAAEAAATAATAQEASAAAGSGGAAGGAAAAGEETASGWAKAIPIIGIAAVGVTALAGTIGHLFSQTVNATISTQQLVSDALSGPGGLADAMQKLATPNTTRGLLEGAKNVANEDAALAQLVSSGHAAEASDLLAKLGVNAQTAAQIFPQYTQALATAAAQTKQTDDTMKDAVSALAAQTASTITSTQAQMQYVASAAGAKATLQSMVLQQYASAQQATLTAQALNIAAPAQDHLTQAAIQASVAYQQTSTYAQEYSSALTSVYTKYTDATAAQAQFTVDLQQLPAQIKQAGVGSAQASLDFTQLSSAAQQAATAIYQQTGSATKADTALQGYIIQIDQAAQKAGYTKSGIDKLNISLFGTPDVKTIHISAPGTDQVTNDIQGILRGLSGIRPGYMMKFSADTTNAVNAIAQLQGQIQHTSWLAQGLRMIGLAHGGAVGGGPYAHAAEGGPRGNLVMVGEHGPEIARLPIGSTIMSNPDSMSMLGGAGTQVQVQLEWTGGAGAGDQLWNWIKSNIRARAGTGSGSVQRALGQGA